MFEVVALICSLATNECHPVKPAPNNPQYETESQCVSDLNRGSHVFAVSGSASSLKQGITVFAVCAPVTEPVAN